ncbi:MAG: hypothetical protein KatS3mg131_1258 [Candidatus Tectimicrobiota bacterium]|nr:MAG: hypothetical protein KatS3mg131_1258 [Candidatus Tectomicrobia bacterium]
MEIAPLRPLPLAPAPATPEGAAPPPRFLDVLRESLARVDGLQHEAERAVRAFLAGEAQSVHETVIALEKADLALRLVTQVRNKVVEAYQEIMRMQI